MHYAAIISCQLSNSPHSSALHPVIHRCTYNLGCSCKRPVRSLARPGPARFASANCPRPALGPGTARSAALARTNLDCTSRRRTRPSAPRPRPNRLLNPHRSPNCIARNLASSCNIRNNAHPLGRTSTRRTTCRPAARSTSTSARSTGSSRAKTLVSGSTSMTRSHLALGRR